MIAASQALSPCGDSSCFLVLLFIGDFGVGPSGNVVILRKPSEGSGAPQPLKISTDRFPEIDRVGISLPSDMIGIENSCHRLLSGR